MKKISVFCFFVATLFVLSSCDSGLAIKEISIAKYPNKIAYIIGKDTSFDLSGCEIEITTKEGSKSKESLDDEHFKGLYTISENIDFNKKGVYKVVISRATTSCSFAIEIVEIQ